MPEADDASLVGMASIGALDYDEDGEMDDGEASSALCALSVFSAGLFTSQFTLLDTIVVVHTCSYVKEIKIARVHSIYIISLLNHDHDAEDQEDHTSLGWLVQAEACSDIIVTGP